MAKSNVHVTPRSEGGWQVKKENATKASAVTETKAQAVQRGTEIAKNQKVELVIHNKNGQISNPNSHGNDPIPPKDKKH